MAETGFVCRRDFGEVLRAFGARHREGARLGSHIPLAVLMRAGVVDETFITLLGTNVRTPGQTVGDIFAQVSALAMMESRLLDVLPR